MHLVANDWIIPIKLIQSHDIKIMVAHQNITVGKIKVLAIEFFLR